jgi:hypothetical protein
MVTPIGLLSKFGARASEFTPQPGEPDTSLPAGAQGTQKAIECVRLHRVV